MSKRHRSHKNVVKSLRKNSVVNFVLAKTDKAYVPNMYGEYGEEHPQYYTIKYLKKENYAIISSEQLQSFDDEWEKTKNRMILVLAVLDHKIETFNVTYLKVNVRKN